MCVRCGELGEQCGRQRIHGIVSYSRLQGLTRPGVHFYLLSLPFPSSSLLHLASHLLASRCLSVFFCSGTLLVPVFHSLSLSLSLLDTLRKSPFLREGKHSQSFSPFCDSISADIAAVSLDSSIRSDEDAAEGDIFAQRRDRDREGDERERERRAGIAGIETENWRSSGRKREMTRNEGEKCA